MIIDCITCTLPIFIHHNELLHMDMKSAIKFQDGGNIKLQMNDYFLDEIFILINTANF